DGLRRSSGRGVSALPGRRYPRSAGTFPRRDDVVAYLERYAAGRRVRTGVAVGRIDPEDDHWLLTTTAGPHTARQVVVATGRYARPRLPRWPGTRSFTGRLLHAADYRHAVPHRHRDVLVVGPGCPGRSP